jgi:hypothetical protein
MAHPFRNAADWAWRIHQLFTPYVAPLISVSDTPDLSTIEIGALREFRRVIRDAAIRDEAMRLIANSVRILSFEDALETVEAELARRFDNRWVP